MAGVTTDPERYQSFLLRLWKETPELPWRFQVRCVSTGKEHRFSELEQVLAFLQEAAAGERGLEADWEGRPGDARSRQGEFCNRLDLAYL